MTRNVGVYRHPEVVESALPRLREDYQSVEGQPFQHFFCPILQKDEFTRLCMGHIINEAIPNSYRGRIVQREDVDNYFGSRFEADFTSLAQARSMAPIDILVDPKMSKKIKPRVLLQGNLCEHYENRGDDVPKNHTRLTVNFPNKRLNWVLKTTPEELDALDQRDFELALGDDYRISAFVSLLKSAYLSLFKILGYSYALSGAGIEFGNGMLGRFYRENRTMDRREARRAACDYFRPYVNMMRPIQGFTGKVPLGTVEDQKARVAVTPSRNIFGMIVSVRTNADFYAVLLPAFNDVEGAVAYHEFLQGDDHSLRVHNCEFRDGTIVVSEQLKQTVWPMGDVTFGFE